MRKDKRWVRNPVLTGFALLGAIGSMQWAWRVSQEDAEVRPRAEQLKSPIADERVAALSEIALLVGVEPGHHAAAFPLVLEAATDHDSSVRAQALVSLGDLAGSIQNDAARSDDRRVARNTILNHFRDFDPKVREAAVASVVRIGPIPDEALFVLTRFAADPRHASMRQVAVERNPNGGGAVIRRGGTAEPDGTSAT